MLEGVITDVRMGITDVSKGYITVAGYWISHFALINYCYFEILMHKTNTSS
jgi:hypothetical protein